MAQLQRLQGRQVMHGEGQQMKRDPVLHAQADQHAVRAAQADQLAVRAAAGQHVEFGHLAVVCLLIEHGQGVPVKQTKISRGGHSALFSRFRNQNGGEPYEIAEIASIALEKLPEYSKLGSEVGWSMADRTSPPGFIAQAGK